MYTLELTPEEVSTIDFVGDRYGWSESLRTHMGKGFQDGILELQEWQAWEVRDACEADTEGGHSFFPMLDHRSDLAAKLSDLLLMIV